MKRSELCIGIDVGTSSLKALAVNRDGAVIASAGVEYEFDSPRAGWAETHPDIWWRAACEALRKLTSHDAVRAGNIISVGLAGQMHGLVIVDSDDRPIRPAMMWNDQRTAEICEKAEREITAAEIWRLTGNRLLPGFTAPKLLWLKQYEPETMRRAKNIMLPKDYVRLRLTGAIHSDMADASGTLLLDCENRKWSTQMCEALSIDTALLPELFESTTPSSRVHADGAAATGLPVGTIVVAGAGDQAAQAVGTGITTEGSVACTVGTSGVIFATTNEWRPTPHGVLHSFCHAIPNRWHLMGVTLSAGGSLRWWRDSMCADLVATARTLGVDPYELMLNQAQNAPLGCEGTVFLPYLSGERTPHADPDARGSFVGMSTRTTREHLTRAIVEGVTCSLREVLALVRQTGARTDRIRLSGGGARSVFWRQLMTDAFELPTATVEQTDGAAYGSALIAGVGAGLWPNIDSATDHIKESNLTNVTSAAADFPAIARRYAQAYLALAPWFANQAKRDRADGTIIG